MKFSFLISLFIVLFFNLIFAQTSRFEKTFRTSADALLTGATIYIVNQTTSDSLQLTEHATRSGTYYRNNVAYGHYKIYVNGTMLIQNYYFAAVRERNIIEQIDPDSNNLIDTQGLEDSIVTKIKLSTAVHQWIETSGGGTIYNFPDDVTIMANPDSTLSVKPDGIGTSHIVDGTILGSDIYNGTITTDDISNNTITASDMNNGSVTSSIILNSTIAVIYIGPTVADTLDTTNNALYAAYGKLWVQVRTGGSLDIESGGVGIKNDDVTSTKIKNNTILYEDLSSSLKDSISHTFDYFKISYQPSSIYWIIADTAGQVNDSSIYLYFGSAGMTIDFLIPAMTIIHGANTYLTRIYIRYNNGDSNSTLDSVKTYQNAGSTFTLLGETTIPQTIQTSGTLYGTLLNSDLTDGQPILLRTWFDIYTGLRLTAIEVWYSDKLK